MVVFKRKKSAEPSQVKETPDETTKPTASVFREQRSFVEKCQTGRPASCLGGKKLDVARFRRTIYIMRNVRRSKNLPSFWSGALSTLDGRKRRLAKSV